MAMALIAGLATAVASQQAAATTIGFDYSGDLTPTVTLGGSGPATLNFTLDFGAAPGQSVTGNFSMEVRNKDGVTVGLIDLLGLDFDQAGSLNFGDTTIPPNGSVLGFSFANLITWSVNLTTDDLSPVTLLIKSTLTPDFEGFRPVLSLAIDGDAHVTPIPGALPLFASGLGVIGLLGWRRRRARVQ
jgi:hypothetical protein